MSAFYSFKDYDTLYISGKFSPGNMLHPETWEGAKIRFALAAVCPDISAQYLQDIEVINMDGVIDGGWVKKDDSGNGTVKEYAERILRISHGRLENLEIRYTGYNFEGPPYFRYIIFYYSDEGDGNNDPANAVNYLMCYCDLGSSYTLVSDTSFLAPPLTIDCSGLNLNVKYIAYAI
jgi:hypothetical protein